MLPKMGSGSILVRIWFDSGLLLGRSMGSETRKSERFGCLGDRPFALRSLLLLLLLLLLPPSRAAPLG